VVRSCGGEGVGPLCEVWRKERARESKIEDAGAPNERHLKPSKHTWGVEEGEAQIQANRGLLFLFFLFFISYIRC